MESSDIRGRPEGIAVVLAVGKEHISGSYRLPQQAPTQVSQDICSWKHQSNPRKLVPGRKLLHLQGKPSQATKRETSISKLLSLGLCWVRAGRWACVVRSSWQEAEDHKRRKKSHCTFLSVHEQSCNLFNKHFQSASHGHHHQNG